MIEDWKDIDGFDGRYEISNLGIVRNKLTGHIMTPQIGWNNERFVCLHKPGNHGKQLRHYICRLVAEAFIPNPNKYWRINHKDLNVENDCADNLEWVETQDDKTDIPDPSYETRGISFLDP